MLLDDQTAALESRASAWLTLCLSPQPLLYSSPHHPFPVPSQGRKLHVDELEVSVSFNRTHTHAMMTVASSGTGCLEQVRTLVLLTLAFFILSCSLRGKRQICACLKQLDSGEAEKWMKKDRDKTGEKQEEKSREKNVTREREIETVTKIANAYTLSQTHTHTYTCNDHFKASLLLLADYP